MNQVAEIIFVVGGAVITLILLLRSRRLNGQQRNAVAGAVFGLFLCGRYAALIDGTASWIFVLGCAGIMMSLAYNNLAFGKVERTSVE